MWLHINGFKGRLHYKTDALLLLPSASPALLLIARPAHHFTLIFWALIPPLVRSSSLTINTFCAFDRRPLPPQPKSSSINVDVFISSSSRGPLSLSSFDVDLIVHRLADIKAYNFFKAAGNRQSKDSKRKVLKAKGKFPMSRGNRYHIPHHYTNTQVQ